MRIRSQDMPAAILAIGRLTTAWQLAGRGMTWDEARKVGNEAFDQPSVARCIRACNQDVSNLQRVISGEVRALVREVVVGKMAPTD